MQKTIARIVSVIFHPLIMPPLGILLLFNSGTHLDFLSFAQKRLIFVIIITGTTILPMSLIPVMILQGIVSDLKMKYSRERVFPLVITALFYIFTWYILSRLRAPAIINVYIITASVTILLCSLVSLSWKVSLHMTALGALAGVILAVAARHQVNLQLYLVFAFLAGGLTGWSRLSLNEHTPSQVYAGYVGGLAIAFFLMTSF